MRVPRVFTKCKAAAAGSVVLMAAGTYAGSPAIRAWAILVAVLAIGYCVHEGVEVVKEHLTKYVFKVFEDGFRGGVEQGREMEAADRFIASMRPKQ